MAAMTLPGSFRPPLPDIETIAPVDASEPVSATLVLRRHAPLPPGARFTAAELATHCGADPADVDAMTSALRELGIDVLEVDAAARRIRVAGSAGGLTPVFGTSLSRVRRADGVEHRYREGALSLPASLAGAGRGVPDVAADADPSTGYQVYVDGEALVFRRDERGSTALLDVLRAP
jgi:kumamolisin